MTERPETGAPLFARIGTRGSALALAQTALAAEALAARWAGFGWEAHIIRTTGDAVQDVPLVRLSAHLNAPRADAARPGAASAPTGAFTSAIERALLAGAVDMAVHSAKDMPTDAPDGLVTAALLPRADARDVLISRSGRPLSALPAGAVIGTSSPRRAAQLCALRPDVRIRDLRGNIDTRLAAAFDPAGPYDAIVLARAGLERLGRLAVVTETFAFDALLPPPAQGVLALQTRVGSPWAHVVSAVDDRPTRLACTAERAFLAALGGGCALPLGVLGEVTADAAGAPVLGLRAHLFSPDGARAVRVASTSPLPAAGALHAAHTAGDLLGRRALAEGAAALIDVLSR